MPIRHVVKQGECIRSIAHGAGLPWRKVWADVENEALRARRDPEVLYPGDVLVVPDREVGEVEAATEQRHRFRALERTVTLRVRLRLEGEARADEPYTLTIGERTYSGKTDESGELRQTIPASARRGLLRLGGPASAEQYALRLGELDPVSEVSGVQARLHALGFGPLDVDGIRGPHTTDAVRRFQAASGLKETGVPDEATRDALRAAYGS